MNIRDVVRVCAVLIWLISVGFAFGCGSPSQAQSTPSSSSVLVTNTASQPVPTLSADAQNSFYANGGCSWTNNSECQVIPLLSVPANKTAVVQSVSGFCQLNSGTQIVYYEFANEANASGNFFLAPSTTAPFNGGVVTAFNENFKTYLHGGTSGVTVIFDAFATAAETNTNDVCNVTASGYFVPVP